MYKNVLIAMGCSVLAIACVPQKKFLEEQNKRTTCEKELETYKTKFQESDTKLTEAQNIIESFNKEISGLKQDTTIGGKSLRNLTLKYDKLNSVNDQLLEKYNRLLEGNISDTKKLSSELQLIQEQMILKQDELKKLEAELNNQKKELETLTGQLKQREQRVTELEGILKSKDDAVNELKKKLSDALLGFEGKGLTITQKNGKVYVSMDENLLFASGSTEVESKGVEALKKVAKVLEQNKDINVLIEGHTDDVPMNGRGEIKDNWDLSVMRATSIVKIMIKNSNMDAKRLTAAGRGENSPLEVSKTPEARRKNRRTEIILTPKLDELLKVLESN